MKLFSLKLQRKRASDPCFHNYRKNTSIPADSRRASRSRKAFMLLRIGKRQIDALHPSTAGCDDRRDCQSTEFRKQQKP